MPYRIDIAAPPPEALDLLIQLGALDVEPSGAGLAAILPDSIQHETVSAALGTTAIVSPATPRDNGSVWLLSARSVQIGGIEILPLGDSAASPAAIRLTDSFAFGTGHHPTTALCIEALRDLVTVDHPDRMLDVGTGSGILAIAALSMGVAQAVGLDIDPEALETAAENARLNQVEDRLRLILGGPEAVDGIWPLIVANVLAAPLIEMAPSLGCRLAPRGRLILSGISASLEPEVRRAYEHVGIRPIAAETRAGWTTLTCAASW